MSNIQKIRIAYSFVGLLLVLAFVECFVILALMKQNSDKSRKIVEMERAHKENKHIERYNCIYR